MGVVVQKYGGSSVSDLTKLNRVADLVAHAQRKGDSLVVVVSAMGNTTDELISLARRMTESPDRRELDMLISVGERISMSLLAMALKGRGVDAVSFTGSQSGIITDESHADAKIVEVRPHRVQKSLDKGQVVIVAGFQGVSRAGEVTTLGRGGSDTTAVALAAALGASVCEIFSDVDGLYSADPSVVSAAMIREHVSLSDALLLSTSGARVLYEGAVAYAQKYGVTLKLRSTFSGECGTTVTAEQVGSADVVGIASDDTVVSVDVQVGLASVQSLLDNGGRLVFGGTRTAFVSLANASGGIAVKGSLVSLVTVVGVGWRRVPNRLSGCLDKVKAAFPASQMVFFDSHRVVWCCSRDESSAVVNFLHDTVVDG